MNNKSNLKFNVEKFNSNNKILINILNKSTFFQSVNYLHNIRSITSINKKIGRYYTI